MPFSSVDIYAQILDNKRKRFPSGFWKKNGKKKAAEVTKYLLEERLHLSEDDIPQSVTRGIFVYHNLYGMMQELFKFNLYETIDNAYPGKYKREDLSNRKKESINV